MEHVLDEPRKRITSRVSENVRATLEQAAELLGATVNQFVVQTAYQEAQRILERESMIRLSQRDARKELLRAAGQEQDSRAIFAVELFCYRARKYLGAYLTVLGGADAVVFGGGIGEHAPEIRRRICDGMDWCGLTLDHDRNRAAVGLAPGGAAQISADGSPLAAYVVAADEETWIARETVRCVKGLQS